MLEAVQKNELYALFHKAALTVKSPRKNAVNPFHKNSYADLGEVIETVKGALAEHGFSVHQCCELILDGKALRVHTTFIHREGGALRSSVDVLLKEPGPQGSMSAYTYGRRYALLSALNLAAEDDDGNAASGITGRKERAVEAIKNFQPVNTKKEPF